MNNLYYVCGVVSIFKNSNLLPKIKNSDRNKQLARILTKQGGNQSAVIYTQDGFGNVICLRRCHFRKSQCLFTADWYYICLDGDRRFVEIQRSFIKTIK